MVLHPPVQWTGAPSWGLCYWFGEGVVGWIVGDGPVDPRGQGVGNSIFGWQRGGCLPVRYSRPNSILSSQASLASTGRLRRVIGVHLTREWGPRGWAPCWGKRDWFRQWSGPPSSARRRISWLSWRETLSHNSSRRPTGGTTRVVADLVLAGRRAGHLDGS